MTSCLSLIFRGGEGGFKCQFVATRMVNAAANCSITGCQLYLVFKIFFLSWKLNNVVKRISLSLDD